MRLATYESALILHIIIPTKHANHREFFAMPSQYSINAKAKDLFIWFVILIKI